MRSSSSTVRAIASVAGILCVSLAGYACGSRRASGPGSATGTSTLDLMKARGLNEADVNAALKTYTPSGKKDEYLTFAGGGHGGFMMIIGVPSMRILRHIAVFSPESWQGYGYGDQSDKVLAGGDRHHHKITWGDSHHPALSETKGDYDGEFLFLNERRTRASRS